MKKSPFSYCIKEFGRDVEITFGEVTQVTSAIISPMRYTNKMYLDADISEIGIMDKSRTLYIGPPETDFTDCPELTRIRCKNREYTVTRADMIYIGDAPAYVWAVLANVVE